MLISASLLLAATSLTFNWLFLIVLVTVGMLAIAFTPYRFVLGYFMLGMVYWISVEGLHWTVVTLSSLTGTDAYVAAIGLSMIPIVIELNGKPRFNKAASQATTNQTMLKSSVQMSAGHRPVVLEKDTDFHQNFVRHASVFDSKH